MDRRMPKTKQALRANLLGIVAILLLVAWAALPIREAGKRAYDAQCGADREASIILCPSRGR